MNKIHLEKKSAVELKKNIDNYMKFNIQFNAELIINKMYMPLLKCLFKETTLAQDMIDLINEYLNDLILLECKADTDIIIRTKDVIINNDNYNFSYSLDVISKYITLQHNISDAYNLEVHPLVAFDMITFFNAYMEHEYMILDYIKIPYEYLIYEGTWKCDIDKYIMNNSCDNSTCISEINREKMKHIIMICKLVIEHIFNAVKKYIT